MSCPLQTTDQAAPNQLTISLNKLLWQQHITKPGGTVLCIQILQKIEKRMKSLLPDALCIIIWPLSHDILECFYPKEEPS